MIEHEIVFFGMGCASTITEYELTEAEKEALKKREPIGFVHFNDKR